MSDTNNAQPTTLTTLAATVASATLDLQTTDTADTHACAVAFTTLRDAQSALNAHAVTLESTAVQARAAAKAAVDIAKANVPFNTMDRTSAILNNKAQMDSAMDTDGIIDTTKAYIKPAAKAVILDSTVTLSAAVVQTSGLILRTVDGAHAVYDKAGAGLEVIAEIGSVFGALTINSANKLNKAVDNHAKKSEAKAELDALKADMAVLKTRVTMQVSLQKEVNANPALFAAYQTMAAKHGLTITKPTATPTPAAEGGLDLNSIINA